MLSVFVFRLRPDALAAGGIAGEVEDVETGRRAAVRSIDELRTFLLRHEGAGDSAAAIGGNKQTGEHHAS